MSPSSWNETNQHWIPRFLLKGFGAKGQASLVYALDKLVDTVTLRKVAEVASARHLLTDRDDQLMKNIEVQSSPVVERIRKGRIEITNRERRILDKLVFALIRNDPYNRFGNDETRLELIQTLSEKIRKTLNLHGGSAEPGTIETFIDERFTHDYLDISINPQDNLPLQALGLMGLTVYDAPADTAFVLGDSPVLILRGTTNGQRSLLNPGSQVILPIHSKKVLVYTWDKPSNLLDSGSPMHQKQVVSLGRDYYRNSNCRYIYGRNQELLGRSQMLQVEWVSPVRSNRVSEGWYKMRLDSLQVAKSRQVNDAEDKRVLDREIQDMVRKAADVQRDINSTH